MTWPPLVWRDAAATLARSWSRSRLFSRGSGLVLGIEKPTGLVGGYREILIVMKRKLPQNTQHHNLISDCLGHCRRQPRRTRRTQRG